MIGGLSKIRDINFLTTLLRLVMSLLCGGIIGIERSYKNRPAGFRTHILVCVGAAIASMTGLYLYLNAHLTTDISRLGAQIVSGLGFIGGGTIIVVNKKKIKGLTTAAGLWVSGIIGLAIGAGFYEGAVVATVLILVTEIWFSRLAAKITRTPKFKILIQYKNKISLNHVLRCCKDNKVAISNLQVTGTSETDSSLYSAIITLQPRKKIDKVKLMSSIRLIVGVDYAEEV
ncbi:MAG: MgtC/SapB family protein [Ruminococcus sp.]|nr:MgtC/SapB family protein [Ruminococcus sp.]